MENWLGSSLNQIQGWTTVQESYPRALEQGSLGGRELLEMSRAKRDNGMEGGKDG